MVFILKSLKMELKIEIGKSHDKHEKFIIIRIVSITKQCFFNNAFA